MKVRTKTLIAPLMLLSFSCQKETSTKYSVTVAENLTQSLLTDSGGHSSKAVKIGSQIWSRQNLSVRYYRNGDHIPQVTDPVKWARLTTGAWCWYNNDSATGHVYGRLYNWYAVNDPRGLAPEGWHIPTDAEWDTLVTFLGDYILAGGRMKSTGTLQAGTGLWQDPNRRATNRSGFTGLPGGNRFYSGIFEDVGWRGYWWSSTEYLTKLAWYRHLYYKNGFIYRNYFNKQGGFSVRCLRD